MKNLLALKVPGYGQINAPDTVPNASDSTAISHYISFAFNIFVVVGFLTAIIFIIYGGFQWISSGGDKQKIESARKVLVFTVVGIILMSLALVIVRFIGSILGVTYF